MLKSKQLVADLLFGIQLIGAIWFGISQISKMLTANEGVLVTWFASMLIFFAFNFVLALNAHRNERSRATIQTLIIYITWLILNCAFIGVMIYRGTGLWNHRDIITAVLILVGVSLTICINRRRFSSLNHLIQDPVIKGWLAVSFKAIPQLVMGYNIMLVGGGDLPLGTILAGHTTVLSRLLYLWFSITKYGRNRNKSGSAISEVSNELSWLVVTVIWLIYR